MGDYSKAKDVGKKIEVAPEQIKYANLLLYGAWTGIVILSVTFLLYVTGIMPSYVEPSQMQQYWGMKSSDYLQLANVQQGWAWLSMLRYGDFVTLIGIALLGMLTVLGYLVILLPAYLAKKDNIYSAIVAVEIVVLVTAASGLLGSGGH